MRLARVAAGALVGVAVLAGCSSKEPASETLPTAAASEALPPLGPADFPMPAEAREKTPAGAEAFLRYFMTLYNAAEASLDPTYMDAFSQNCETCDQLIQNLKEDAESGYTYEGGIVTITAVSSPSLNGLSAETAFSMEQTALTVRDGQQAPLAHLSAPAANLNCGAIFVWSQSESTWIFSQWDVN
jgi:hypothetical protein